MITSDFVFQQWRAENLTLDEIVRRARRIITLAEQANYREMDEARKNFLALNTVVKIGANPSVDETPGVFIE